MKNLKVLLKLWVLIMGWVVFFGGLSMLLSFTSLNTSKASWYGPGFHGKVTANGETYHQDSLTCASPTLPFNTKVEVRNISNNKKIIVRVNDRGPYHCYIDSLNKVRPYYPLEPHHTRVLDLSKGAFKRIANLGTGVIKIEYRIIE